MESEKNSEIEKLNREKKDLIKKFNQIKTEMNSISESYRKKLTELGNKIRDVNSKIYNIKHPEED